MKKKEPLTTHSHFKPFGGDTAGRVAEKFARSFGTGTFLICQTLLIILWMILNGLILKPKGWDPYPWILLNLVFSTQAAYAAPLILLAQARQADRDKIQSTIEQKHREEIAAAQQRELDLNTKLTKEIHELSKAIHQHIEKEQNDSKSRQKVTATRRTSMSIRGTRRRSRE